MSVAEIGNIAYFSSTCLKWHIPRFSDVQKNSRIWGPKFGYSGEITNNGSLRQWMSDFPNTTFIKIILTSDSNDIGNIDCIRVGVTDESENLIDFCDCVLNSNSSAYSFDGTILMRAKVLTDYQSGKISGHLRLFCEIPKETCMQFDDAATQTTAENDCDVLQQDLKKLFISEKDFDFTIKVKEREFHVHKVLLKARSSVFDSMLSHDMKENKDNRINVEDCDPDVFAEFLHFVYYGKVEDINSGNACGLFYIADKYNVQNLKKICVNFLKQSFSVENVCEIICLATKHRETNLLRCAEDFFAKNLEKILITCNWLQFMKDNSVEANELYLKSLKLGYTKKC